jgi:hypothetical protein
MSVLTEIQTYLTSLGTLGVIKIGFMPATPDVLGVLYEYGGQMPERAYGVAGIKYEKPAFQHVFRGAPLDYAGPRAKAEIAYRALAAVQPGALGGGVSTEYLMIDPQQAPHPVEPVDVNNRHYIGVNFYAMKVLS